MSEGVTLLCGDSRELPTEGKFVISIADEDKRLGRRGFDLLRDHIRENFPETRGRILPVLATKPGQAFTQEELAKLLTAFDTEEVISSC